MQDYVPAYQQAATVSGALSALSNQQQYASNGTGYGASPAYSAPSSSAYGTSNQGYSPAIGGYASASRGYDASGAGYGSPASGYGVPAAGYGAAPAASGPFALTPQGYGSFGTARAQSTQAIGSASGPFQARYAPIGNGRCRLMVSR